MNALENSKNPMTVGLVVVGSVALGLAVLLGAVALGQANAFSIGGPDVAFIASLGAWSNLLILVSVVSYVGAAVLAGMRWLLRAPVAGRQSEPSYQDADGR